jgi:tRNA(Ile)-lysidine synthase
MRQLLDQLTAGYAKFFRNKTLFLLGLSGGMDSVLLLNLFAKLRQQLLIEVSAVHVNHGISANADNWEQFCVKACQQLNIPLEVSRVTVNKLGGESLENNARQLRYAAFKNYPEHVVVLAHHQNDQVETLISQLLRGSDIHNLAAMTDLSTRNGQLYWRPLLSTPRQEIESLVAKYKLQYIEDESNQDTSYLRNFVRHQLLPLILSWDTTVFSKLIGVTNQLQQTTQLLDEIALADFNQVKTGGDKIMLDVDKFTQLTSSRQINLLSYYIHLYKFKLPSRKKIIEFVRQVNFARWDKKPSLILATAIPARVCHSRESKSLRAIATQWHGNPPSVENCHPDETQSLRAIATQWRGNPPNDSSLEVKLVRNKNFIYIQES